MEKNMENKMETVGPFKEIFRVLGWADGKSNLKDHGKDKETRVVSGVKP